MNDQMKMIVEKMCGFAGVDYATLDMEDPEWFLKHTWTIEESRAFYNWFMNYLKNPVVWLKLYKCGSNNLSRRTLAVSWFTLRYGWEYQSR